MARVKNILFVCTGNTCRSVMAEAFMRKTLSALGKNDIDVLSAGIAAVTGAAPMDETDETMKEFGIDVSSCRARDLDEVMIGRADLILVMEQVHKEEVIRRFPFAAPKVFLLKEYAYPEPITDPSMYGIDDPVGWGVSYYRHTAGVIKREIERIAVTL